MAASAAVGEEEAEKAEAERAKVERVMVESDATVTTIKIISKIR